MEIRPNTQKNFLIARVAVKKEDLKPSILSNVASIFIPVGYSLYYTKNGNLTKYADVKDQKVSGEDLVKSIGKDFTTLYWIPGEKRQITVAWGIVKSDNMAFNGSLKLTVDAEKLFSLQVQKVYETERNNMTGLEYEYLSEYFVNEKNEQNGVSIFIRELLVPYLAELEDCEAIKEETESKTIKDLFSSLGMQLIEDSIEVYEKKNS